MALSGPLVTAPNRSVPKFMKRNKSPDYRGQHVFGVPPLVHVQRTGQPLPQSIQQAMRYLRSQCLDQVSPTGEPAGRQPWGRNPRPRNWVGGPLGTF